MGASSWLKLHSGVVELRTAEQCAAFQQF